MYRYSCVYAFRLNNICFKEVKNVEVLGQCQLEENSTNVSYNTCISLVRVRMGSKEWPSGLLLVPSQEKNKSR